MPPTTISGREFTQDAARAKLAAIEDPVVITDPAGIGRNLVDILAMPEISGIEVEFGQSRALPRPADFG